VLDQLVVENFETNPVSGVDLEGFDVVAGLGTHIASQVFLAKVLEGRVVRVGVAPHVGVPSAGLLAIDNGPRKEEFDSLQPILALEPVEVSRTLTLVHRSQLGYYLEQ